MKSPYLNADTGVAPPPPTMIAECPNPECGDDCTIEAWTSAVASIAPDGYYQIVCSTCDYHAPRTTDLNTAIRLHNLLCRPTPQPTPEAADTVTVDKRDMFDFVRASIKEALHIQAVSDEAEAWSTASDMADECLTKLYAHPPKPEPTEAVMTDAQIKHMVDRFLGWRLPENFTPDAGISFKPTFNDHLPVPMKHEPTGTNLFDATQADAMVRYLVEGLPAAVTAPKPTEEWMEAASEINDAIDAAIGRDESGITDEAIAAIIAKHYTAPAEG